MPKSTVREESAYPLPEDTLFEAKLNSVVVRTVDFTYKKGPNEGQKGSFDLWVWEFQITEGEFAGQRVWGETEDHVSNLDEPKGRAKLVRPWAETLLNRQLAVGAEFDTNDVVGLPVKLTVKHEEPRKKKDGGTFYGCPVEDLIPATSAAFSTEPPF